MINERMDLPFLIKWYAFVFKLLNDKINETEKKGLKFT